MIIIAGDSWGCGEWSTTDALDSRRFISHNGLTGHLLALGRQVINLSEPGTSNDQTFAKLENFFLTNHHYEIDGVFVFQTEWIRSDISEQDLALGYQSLKDHKISNFYYGLGDLSQRFNVRFYIIGGSSDTVWLSEFAKEYPGVEIVCQSFTNLMLNHNDRIDDPVYALGCFSRKHLETVERIKSRLSSTDLELLVQDLDRGRRRRREWQDHPEFFWPDGIHPNRVSYQKLFEHIKGTATWL